MNIVLLGGAGYVGQVLLRHLRHVGHQIKVIDLFNFAMPEHLSRLVVRWRVQDTRELTTRDFAGADVVCDLSAISNDPSGELDPELTHAINVEARARNAMLAKDAGVRRHLLFSSCSVYGICEEIADERASLRPLTEYAISNVRAEERVLALADRSFCATAFRLATVFGPSEAMRFDLVVNTMTRNAVESGTVMITGGGEQFRPLIHIADVADATARVLTMPVEAVCGDVFNLVHRNMRIKDLAQAVIQGIGRSIDLRVEDGTVDRRNYQVDGTKALRVFGFNGERTVEQAAREITARLAAGDLDVSPRSIRLNGYRRMSQAVAS